MSEYCEPCLEKVIEEERNFLQALESDRWLIKDIYYKTSETVIRQLILKWCREGNMDEEWLWK